MFIERLPRNNVIKYIDLRGTDIPDNVKEFINKYLKKNRAELDEFDESLSEEEEEEIDETEESENNEMVTTVTTDSEKQ